MALTKEKIVGVKELRENLEKFIVRINKGESFTVVRRSKPVFVISPPGETIDGRWELIADFTKIHPKGVDIRDIIAALE